MNIYNVIRQCNDTVIINSFKNKDSAFEYFNLALKNIKNINQSNNTNTYAYEVIDDNNYWFIDKHTNDKIIYRLVKNTIVGTKDDMLTSESCEDAGINAIQHGFYDDILYYLESIKTDVNKNKKDKHESIVNAYICQFLLGIVKECTEAMDALNSKNPDMNNFAEELADIKIRVDSLAYCLDIPIAKIQKNKMEFNKTREYLHGKKF